MSTIQTFTDDEQFTIRECIIGQFITSDRVDETNAIQVWRKINARVAAMDFRQRFYWDLDTLRDDMEATERAWDLICRALDA